MRIVYMPRIHCVFLMRDGIRDEYFLHSTPLATQHTFQQNSFLQYEQAGVTGSIPNQVIDFI